jgi:hypothetical protein
MTTLVSHRSSSSNSTTTQSLGPVFSTQYHPAPPQPTIGLHGADELLLLLLEGQLDPSQKAVIITLRVV